MLTLTGTPSNKDSSNSSSQSGVAVLMDTLMDIWTDTLVATLIPMLDSHECAFLSQREQGSAMQQ